MFRRMRINTQERAISGDHNRAWALETKGVAEVLRRLLLVRSEETAPGLLSEPATLTAPLTAEILRGLMVRPSVGSFNVLIDPGIVVVVDPSNMGPDDSTAVPINSAGVTSPGALAMTGNASGSPRIDVIECRLNPIPITATDNRDIFDPITGLFTATTVTKEIEPQLEFRVRLGTPGAGYPGSAAGWLPLAIAHVPVGATDNDVITFWDVRPLVEDRVQGPVNVDTRSEIVQLDARWSRASSTSWIVNGIWRARFRGRYVGGAFRRGSPGVDGDTIDFGDASNKTSGIAEGSALSVYGYVCFPFGLPRWSRYTDASSGQRVPREPKGIPILTSIAPTADGHPSSTIPLDAIGFAGGTTSDALFCFFNLASAATSNQLREAWFQNKVLTLTGSIGTATGAYQGISASVAGATATFDVPVSTIPLNAKAAMVTVEAGPSIGANNLLECEFRLHSYFDGSASNPSAFVNGGSFRYANPTAGSLGTLMRSPPIRLPMSPKRPLGAPATPHKIAWESHSSIAGAGATLRVVGWEF